MRRNKKGDLTPEPIRELVELCFSDNENRKYPLRLGKVSEKVCDKILADYDLDIYGFVIYIDAYGIRHSWKKHSNEKAEDSRGNIAITKQNI